MWGSLTTLTCLSDSKDNNACRVLWLKNAKLFGATRRLSYFIESTDRKTCRHETLRSQEKIRWPYIHTKRFTITNRLSATKCHKAINLFAPQNISETQNNSDCRCIPCKCGAVCHQERKLQGGFVGGMTLLYLSECDQRQI